MWFVMTAAGQSHATDDPVRALQLDQRAAAKFAERIARSVFLVQAEAKPADWADQRMAGPKVAGLAVLVNHPTAGPVLLTGGVFGAGVRNAKLRLTDDKSVPVRRIVALGDGGLSRLDIADSAIRNLRGLPLSSSDKVAAGMPVLSVSGIDTDSPTLFYGVLLSKLPAPLSHIYPTDIAFPHGAALVSASGKLVGITYRLQPNEDSIGWAIGAETIDAWLRPESEPTDTREGADTAN